MSLSLFLGCTQDKTGPEEAVSASKDHRAQAAVPEQPPLAVATIASLISVNDVMVREPERFKKVLCSDSKFYDLDYKDGRYSLSAEPLSVCVLLADSKDLKPLGICGDESCAAAAVSACNDPEKKELLKSFANEQTLQRCWNIGSFASLQFTVLMTKIGQSCQAQTLAKTPKGWLLLNSIDGSFETRKTATAEGTGCWWEAGSNFSFEGDWFGQQKRVMPIMAFQKQDGLYALIRNSWSGSESYQLFRLDGEKAVEIESFAEAFKETQDEPSPAPAVKAAPAAPDVKAKTQGKATSKGKKGKAAPVDSKSEASEEQGTASPQAEESASPLEAQPIQEAVPDIESSPEPDATPEAPAKVEGAAHPLKETP